MDYVSHLADDQSALLTACGEPWQGWQAPGGHDLREAALPPHEQPRPHKDEIRLCQACLRKAQKVRVMGVDGHLPYMLLAGVYRHYKGPLYLVLGYAHDANIADRWLVIYVGLELSEAHTGPRLAARTDDDFFVMVHPDEGSVCPPPHCDRAVPRFEYLGPIWMGDR